MKKEKKLKIIMTVGLPASGKSTWAKAKVKEANGEIKRINKDDLRLMIDVGKWSKEREKFTIIARDALVTAALKMNKSVIVDDTNLVPKHKQSLEAIANKFTNVEVEVVDHFLDVPVEECIKRDEERGTAKVGRDVIIRMAGMAGIKISHLERITKHSIDARRKQIGPNDSNLEECIIVDLDGTLSIMWGNRNAYEAEKCDSDLLNEPIARILHDYHKLGTKIILFSGRTDTGYDQTLNWLDSYNIPYDELQMRKDGDFRKDTIVKEEMYKALVEDKMYPLFVLDDRDMMVEHWRNMGLTCLQVYWGAF